MKIKEFIADPAHNVPKIEEYYTIADHVQRPGGYIDHYEYMHSALIFDDGTGPGSSPYTVGVIAPAAIAAGSSPDSDIEEIMGWHIGYMGGDDDAATWFMIADDGQAELPVIATVVRALIDAMMARSR